MALSYQVDFSPSQMAELDQLLGGERAARVAMQAAVSDTVRAGRAMIARRLAEEINLPITQIKDNIDAKYGSYSDPSGSISISRYHSVWLGQFIKGTNKLNRLIRRATDSDRHVSIVLPSGPVTLQIRKRASGPYAATQTFPHAFIEMMPNSVFPGVFERTGIKRVMESGRYAGKVREVIHRMRGPTPLGVLLNAQGEEGAATIIDEVTETLGAVLEKNLASQIDRFLNNPSSLPASAVNYINAN